MHYLIDGHNLIAKLPDISLEDPNDEVLLVLRLRSWVAAGRKRKVTVIFDGGLPGGRSRFHSTGGLEVIFAPEGVTADALLIRRIRKIKNPPETILISSDQEVIDAARARRMRHVDAEEFAQRLSEVGKKDQEQPEPASPAEAEDPALSQEEVSEWLALFAAAPKPRPPKPSPQPRAKEKPAAGKHPRSEPAAKRDVDPAVLKSGDDALSNDEVDEWLKLFGQGE